MAHKKMPGKETISSDSLLIPPWHGFEGYNCIDEIEDLLEDNERTLASIFQELLTIIPPAWQYPEYCQVRIQYAGEIYQLPSFEEGGWAQHSAISIQNTALGQISVFYKEDYPNKKDDPFTEEEEKILELIADKVSHFILIQGLEKLKQKRKRLGKNPRKEKRKEWQVVLCWS